MHSTCFFIYFFVTVYKQRYLIILWLLSLIWFTIKQLSFRHFLIILENSKWFFDYMGTFRCNNLKRIWKCYRYENCKYPNLDYTYCVCNMVLNVRFSGKSLSVFTDNDHQCSFKSFSLALKLFKILICR